MVEIEIPEKAAKILRQYAKETGQPVEVILTDIIKKYLERNEKNDG